MDTIMIIFLILVIIGFVIIIYNKKKQEKFEILNTVVPTGYDKITLIKPLEFSTKNGNNFSPGKYGDLELYIMGLINETELLERKKKLYNEAHANKLISLEQLNERLDNNEVLRVYNNVYQFNNFFIGQPTKYSLDSIKNICETQRDLCIINNNNFMDTTINKPVFKNVNVLFTNTDPTYMLKSELDKINFSINRFSNKVSFKKPYNFSAATEEKAYCNFTFTHTDIESNVKANIIEPTLLYKNGEEFLEIYNVVNRVETKIDNIIINNISYKIKYFTNYEKPYEYTSKTKFKIINGIPYLNTTPLIDININKNISNYSTPINLNVVLNNNSQIIYYIKIIYKNVEEYYRFYTDINDSNPVSLITDSTGIVSIPYSLPKIDTINASLKLITHFTDDYLTTNYYNNYINKTNNANLPKYNNTNIISAYTNDKNTLLIIRLDSDLYNEVFKYVNYHKTMSMINFIENSIITSKINFINYIPYEPKNVIFRYLSTSNNIIKTNGIIYLNNINQLNNGAYLHEISHQSMNYLINVNSVIPSNKYYNNNNFIIRRYQEEIIGKLVGFHWGYSNVYGQLGGYSDTNAKYLTNIDANYNLLNDNIKNFINYLIDYIDNNNIVNDPDINKVNLDLQRFNNIQGLVDYIYINNNLELFNFADEFNSFNDNTAKNNSIKFFLNYYNNLNTLNRYIPYGDIIKPLNSSIKLEVLSYITITNTIDYFEKRSFTIEWWQYRIDNNRDTFYFNNNSIALGEIKSTRGNSKWLIVINKKKYTLLNDNISIFPMNNTWNHIALSVNYNSNTNNTTYDINLNGNTLRFNMNLTDITSTSNININLNKPTQELIIGDNKRTGFGGYISGFKITPDKALYTNNVYTVPSRENISFNNTNILIIPELEKPITILSNYDNNIILTGNISVNSFNPSIISI